MPAIAAAARAAGCVTVMDNTWASPLFLKPFALGVDVSVQAATKYIGGHSDLMLGVVTAAEAVHERVRKAAFELGAPAGPDDVYLAQRGLRTLAVRLRRHMESGLAVARWLQGSRRSRASSTRASPTTRATRCGGATSPARAASSASSWRPAREAPRRRCSTGSNCSPWAFRGADTRASRSSPSRRGRGRRRASAGGARGRCCACTWAWKAPTT